MIHEAAPYIPLVTVLICSRNRRERLARAIECYREQDYPHRELVVMEDGDDSNCDLLVGIRNSRYFWYEAKNLSAKRNAGISVSAGTFLCHFDDDDWQGPHRVSDQVSMFQEYPATEVAGYGHCYWWDEVRKCASLYKGPPWGASLLYRREYLLRHPWDESIEAVEDTPFLHGARLVEKAAGENMVAVMHDGNWQCQYTPEFWPVVPFEELPQGFRKTLEVTA